MCVVIQGRAREWGRPIGAVARRFRRAAGGLAAIEFAMILPLLLLMFVSTIEIARGFDERRKVDRLAATICDVLSQQTTAKPVATSTLASLLAAAPAMTEPYPSDRLTVTASVVSLNVRADGTCCDARVRWSYARGGVLRPCGTNLDQVAETVPAAPTNILASAIGDPSTGSTLPGDIVVTDVSDQFQPLFDGLFSVFAGGFHRTSYLAVRESGQLSIQTPIAPYAGQTGQNC